MLMATAALGSGVAAGAALQATDIGTSVPVLVNALSFAAASLLGIGLVMVGLYILLKADNQSAPRDSGATNYLDAERRSRARREASAAGLVLIALGALLAIGSPTLQTLGLQQPAPQSSPAVTPAGSPQPTESPPPTGSPTPGPDSSPSPSPTATP